MKPRTSGRPNKLAAEVFIADLSLQKKSEELPSIFTFSSSAEGEEELAQAIPNTA